MNIERSSITGSIIITIGTKETQQLISQLKDVPRDNTKHMLKLMELEEELRHITKE